MDNTIEAYRKRRQARLDAIDFNEKDHPRDKGGKFTSKGNAGGGASNSGSESKKESGGTNTSGVSKTASGGVYGVKKAKFSETVHREERIAKDDPRIIRDEEGKPPYIKGVIGSSALIDDGFSANAPECARRAYEQAQSTEREITQSLMDLADQNGDSLEGLEFCMKAPSSMEQKIPRMKKKKKEKFGLDYTTEQCVAEMDDLNRYTYMAASQEDLVKTVLDVERALQRKGFRQVERDNKYNNVDPDYKDVKLVFKDRNGRDFEVQIHSAESMKVKNANHAMYEEQRKVDTSDEKRAELGELMKKNTRELKNPKGIENLESFKR